MRHMPAWYVRRLKVAGVWLLIPLARIERQAGHEEPRRRQEAQAHRRRAAERQGVRPMHYLIDIPNDEMEDREGATAEIAEDAQWFIDNYAYESYCSMVEKMGESE